VHSKILGFIYLCHLFALFVITCSVVSFNVALSYLDLSQTFLTFNTPCARCYFFFSQKEYSPTWQSIPSHTHTHTHTKKKFGYAKPSWNSCCTHDIPSPSLSPSFGLFFHLLSFFSFWLCSYPFFSHDDFLTTRKRKFALSISSLQFQGCSLPTDTMLLISFQLRHD